MGGDINRLAVLGDSAGGNLAINLAYAAARGDVRADCADVPLASAVVVQYPAVDPWPFMNMVIRFPASNRECC